ncbi:hypothetical protein [uncultured Eubacterium sp.]|uniref:hypothetical protein n=1 Tax=uncultured Eubacterium sp. TaxID=165185 RepID=UPI002620E3CA|nr:hypothetical protein [uncultured Eubacterium sp.]
MKLAKKTLSVALAAVMAASSLAGTVSAFAAPNFYVPSEAKYQNVTVGTTTITPDVKFDTKYAQKKADITDANKNMNNQIDQTTLNNYYAFTPAKTGVYTISVTSTAVFKGIDKRTYDAAPSYFNDAEKKEAATKYASKVDGLYKTGTWAEADKLTAADALDSVTISDVKGKDAFLTTTTVTSKDTSTSTPVVLSYKYDAAKKAIVVEKEVKTTTVGKPVAVNAAYLVAGKTYYFQATVKNFLETEEVKDSKGDVYVNVKKSAAAPSAKLTIAMEQGEKVDTTYTTTTQKVEVPFDFVGGNYDAKTGKYYVEKTVSVPAKTVTYAGLATTYTVKDTVDGVKVEKFVNNSSIRTLTLGKFVKTVEGCNKSVLKNVTITNPDFVVNFGDFNAEAKLVVPANSVAHYTAVKAGYDVTTACTHKWGVTKAATIFAAGEKKCSECDKVEAIAKLAFAPTAKASKKKIVVKGNAGKVAKLAVWVYNSNGKLVKKQVKKNVTKNTVKVAKAGKYTVKVKAYGTNGAKTASVKKTVKVK